MKKNSITVVLRLTLGLAVWFMSIMIFSRWLEPMIFAGVSDNIRLIVSKMIFPYTIGLAGFYLIAGKMEKMQPKAGQNVTVWLLIKGLIVQTGISIPVIAIVNILIDLMGGTVTNTMVASLFGKNWLFYAVLLLLFNPIMEEVLFRKLILDRFLVLGEGKAIIISAVLFAIPHVISQGIPQMVGTFIIALVWGHIRLKTGKLWPCMILHGCFNLISGYIIQALYKTPIGSAVILFVFMFLLPILAIALLIKKIHQLRHNCRKIA